MPLPFLIHRVRRIRAPFKGVVIHQLRDVLMEIKMDRSAQQTRGLWVEAGLIAAAAIALSGCAEIRSGARDFVQATNLTPLPVDPSSPVAAAVARAEEARGPIPSFASVPPRPADVRSPEAYKAEVVSVVSDRRNLARWESAHPPMADDTEGFAQAQRAKLAGEAPVSPEREAETAAFANRLKQAAGAPNASTPK